MTTPKRKHRTRTVRRNPADDYLAVLDEVGSGEGEYSLDEIREGTGLPRQTRQVLQIAYEAFGDGSFLPKQLVNEVRGQLKKVGGSKTSDATAFIETNKALKALRAKDYVRPHPDGLHFFLTRGGIEMTVGDRLRSEEAYGESAVDRAIAAYEEEGLAAGKREARKNAKPRTRTYVEPHAAHPRARSCRLCKTEHTLKAHSRHQVDAPRFKTTLAGVRVNPGKLGKVIGFPWYREVVFLVDKRGRRSAHGWSMRAGRFLRVPLAEAELAVAAGHVRVVDRARSLMSPPKTNPIDAEMRRLERDASLGDFRAKQKLERMRARLRPSLAGKVVHFVDGPRRYVVAFESATGELWLVALSGAKARGALSPVKRDRVVLDRDQSVTFSGKEAAWLKNQLGKKALLGHVMGYRVLPVVRSNPACRSKACAEGRHDYAEKTRACSRKGCGARLDEPGQGFIFGHDPAAEAEIAKRVARSGQSEMFGGQVRNPMRKKASTKAKGKPAKKKARKAAAKPPKKKAPAKRKARTVTRTTTTTRTTTKTNPKKPARRNCGRKNPVLGAVALTNPRTGLVRYGDLPARLRAIHRKAAMKAARFHGIPLAECMGEFVTAPPGTPSSLALVGDVKSVEYQTDPKSKRARWRWRHEGGDHGRGKKKTRPGSLAVDAKGHQYLVSRRGARPSFSSDRGLIG